MRTRKSRGERGARARSAQVFSSASSSSRGADAAFLCTGTDSCASPDPSHSLFISCESLLNDCEIAPLNRVYVHEKARLSVHPLAENDTVDVRSGELNREICVGEVVADDALSAQQWQEQKEALNGYKQIWVDLRPKLDATFLAEGKARPTTFSSAFAEHGQRFLPANGKLLYDGGLRRVAADGGDLEARFDTDIDTVKHFIDSCPPFRAFLCGIFMSWYQHSARDDRFGERFRAGRNDLFMSVYLSVL
jgi:hypothetical protein